jgi:hypothetical protein
MSAASQQGRRAAASPLERLADALLPHTDLIAGRTVDRMQEALPSYAKLPREALLPIVTGNVRNVVTAVRDPDADRSAELEHYEESGEERARQGISSDEMLQGWRIGLAAVREQARVVAEEHDIGNDVLLEFVEALLEWGDVGMLKSVSAHRHAEFEMARQRQHHRTNLVRGVLFGTLPPASGRVQIAAYGLDPERLYCAVRARPSDDVSVRTLERALGVADSAGPRTGLAALLDGDLAGFVLAPVTTQIEAHVGVGPPAQLEALENSFRLATRALESAVAIGSTGPTAIDRLGLWPAVLADRDVGDEVIRRIIDPVMDQGKTGAVLLETVARYLDNDLRLEVTAEQMYLHVNTVRYRLRRLEELTGMNLRRVGDLVQIWWAIERVRLTHAPDIEL